MSRLASFYIIGSDGGGNPFCSGITSVSGDSQLLSGSLHFWRDEEDTLTAIIPSGWEIPPEVFGLPGSFRDAVVYGGNHYVAADCTTLDFGNFVCVLNVETGQLVAMIEVGDRLVDFQEVDGQIALIVNGDNGTGVYLNLDLQTRVELSDRLGTTTTAYRRTGLNAGWLRMVVQMNGAVRAVVFDLVTEPDEEAIAVQTAVHQLTYPANVLSTSRGVFEVAIRGTADFDTRSIDTSTLFIGDPRSVTSAWITSVRSTDLNRDGHRDLLIKVDSRQSGIRADTTSLKITAQTQDGPPINGTRQVTMTDLSFLTYWATTIGQDWRRQYQLYRSQELRRWW